MCQAFGKQFFPIHDTSEKKGDKIFFSAEKRIEVDIYHSFYYACAFGDFNPLRVYLKFCEMVGYDGRRGPLKKYKCRIAALDHIL